MRRLKRGRESLKRNFVLVSLFLAVSARWFEYALRGNWDVEQNQTTIEQNQTTIEQNQTTVEQNQACF